MQPVIFCAFIIVMLLLDVAFPVNADESFPVVNEKQMKWQFELHILHHDHAQGIDMVSAVVVSAEMSLFFVDQTFDMFFGAF